MLGTNLRRLRIFLGVQIQPKVVLRVVRIWTKYNPKYNHNPNPTSYDVQPCTPSTVHCCKRKALTLVMWQLTGYIKFMDKAQLSPPSPTDWELTGITTLLLHHCIFDWKQEVMKRKDWRREVGSAESSGINESEAPRWMQAKESYKERRAKAASQSKWYAHEADLQNTSFIAFWALVQRTWRHWLGIEERLYQKDSVWGSCH